MLNHFSKILIFFLYIALPIYAMETNNECNQPSYNPEANSKLLQIINTFWKENPTEEDLKELTTERIWKNIIKCLESGADPNLKGNGTTILGVAIFGSICGVKIKQYLYDFFRYGVNPNISDDDGLTPLHALLSLKKNPYNLDLEMLEILLQHNANPNLPLIRKIPNTQKNCSFSPLDFAVQYRNKDFVKILIKYNANINAKSSFYNIQFSSHYNITPLARAIIRGKLATMKVLCREYASLENVNDFHRTAFEVALKELQNPEPTIKNLIVNARFKLPTTEKKLDLSIALELLLILKYQFKHLKIPEDLKFRMLSLLPAAQNWTELDSILYQKLLYKNYKKPYLFARLHHHITNIKQILHNEDTEFGIPTFALLNNYEKTNEIIPKLKKDIKILLESKQEVSSDNLALQICNNYEELEEEQIQSTK